MKTIHIEITPEEFGVVARDGMTHGFDVTPYLVRSAVSSFPSGSNEGCGTIAHGQVEPTPAPKLPPAPSSGIFDNTPAA